MYCKNCKSSVPFDHQCYIQKYCKKNTTSGLGFFLDNVSQRVSNEEKQELEPQIVHENIKDLVAWMLGNQKYILITHKPSQEYMYSIIEQLAKYDTQKIRVIANEHRIMMIEFKNIKIIDSHFFIPIALSDFSQAFGILCSNNVQLLALGCIKYSNISKLNEGLCPFRTCITGASAYNKIYRRNYMPENKIYLLPASNSTYHISAECDAWLKQLSRENPEYDIFRNGYFVGKYRLDGICHKTKTIFDYNNCEFHWCPTCNKQGESKHIERKRYIMDRMPGYSFIEMWSHECKSNVESLEPPIYPRDAYYKNTDTSLYPYIFKYKKFPVGHPRIITQNFEPIEHYFGIVKCELEPPENFNLYPFKKIGTYVTEEVKAALALGYKLVRIFEVWHFDSECGLFTSYIDSALKEAENIDPARRFVAKLKAESLWEYFAQIPNRVNFKIVQEPDEWQRLLQTYQVMHTFHDANNYLYVRYIDRQVLDLGKTNVLVAAFVACYARISKAHVLFT